VSEPSKAPVLRFGAFELDIAAEKLFKQGRTVRLQPQPFKVLRLLASTSGRMVSREEIQATLWTSDTFVDFDQGVNFAVKQVREALGEDAERAVYIETIPKRGYRFIAPVEVVGPPDHRSARRATTDFGLLKALWANIAALRLLEERRKQRRRVFLAVGVSLGVVALITALIVGLR
jgi:DNA-binding winged helix-turn-helix (wHTH) protein